MVPYAYEHKPVMPEECIRHLDIKEDGTYIDATLGGGGHSSAILQRLGRGGKLICIDRDEASVRIAGKRLLSMATGAGLEIIRGNFADISALCAEKGVTGADGILFDLGVSSWQIDDPERGFSYISDAALDMRMDRSAELDAYAVVNTYDENRLRDILREYGEEKWASRIASFIATERLNKPVTTTGELAGLVRAAIPSGARKDGGNPAKRTFQAIRIEVNNELQALKKALKASAEMLLPGGRICVLTFHSLEDRIVKEFFRSLSGICVCPRDLPVCVCGRQKILDIVTKKPVLPSEAEIKANPRAKSAKLRCARRTEKNESND